MLIILVLGNVLYELVVCIEHECDIVAEHGRIHACHAVHFHHFLHPAILLGEGHHRRNVCIFQLLDLDRQLVVAKSLAEDIC